MVRLYVEGVPGLDVAAEMGCSLPTVMKEVRLAGVAVHDYGPDRPRAPGNAVTFSRVCSDEGKGSWRWIGKYRRRTIVLSESRVLASKKIGRDLRGDEFVHFVDNDPYNTDEENLYVTTHRLPSADPTHPDDFPDVFTCTTCGQVKPVDEFPKWGRKCKRCGSVHALAYRKARYALDPEEHRKQNARLRKAQLMRKYGLTVEEAEAFYRSSNGLCQICGKPSEDDRKYLNIDHNHATGQLRGVLCSHCNRGLGFFMDDLANLRSAVAYLEAAEARAAASVTSER